MSHLPLSLVNRLNKTECTVFNFWALYFQRIPFIDYLDITTAVVVPCGVPKSLPVHRYGAVIYSASLGL